MYKRYQVLLPDWLEDYIKYISSKYGLSFSEIIRLELCFSMLATAIEFYPEYEAHVTLKEIFNQVRKFTAKEIDRDEFKGIVSKIYFETRKAIEYMTENSPKDSK